MKKVFLSLFVAGALSFGLQSCGGDDENPCDSCTSNQTCVNDECVDNVETCDVCGTYTNDATGSILIPGIIDTTFTSASPLNLPATVSETSTSGELSLAVDLSNLTPLLTTPVTVTGSYNSTTKVLTITDEVYTYLSIPILINGTVDFSTTNTAVGNLTLADGPGGTLGIQGNMDFTGTK